MITTEDCDVLLFAAGFGKRLEPLTLHTPKPLVEVAGKPLIVWNLELLSRNGFRHVFINLHHLGSKIREYVGDGSRWNIAVSYSEEPKILDTGGGIKKVTEATTRPYLVTVNGDTLVETHFGFEGLLREHSKGANATLLVRRDPMAASYGSLGVRSTGEVVRFLDAWAPDKDQSSVEEEVMYTGIQILSREYIDRLPPVGSVFSITRDSHRMCVREGGLLRTVRYDGAWYDVGTPERLEYASKNFMGS